MCIRYNNGHDGGSFIHQPTIKSEPVQRQQSEDSSTHCATTGTSNGLPTLCIQQPYSRKQRYDCLNYLIRQYGSEAILSLDWSRIGEEFSLKSVTKSNLSDSNLVDSKLPESNLVDSKLVDSNLDIKLPDSKLPDINQVDSKPLDSKLPDINQVDSKPLDSKLPDINQVDSKPLDSKLPDINQVDSKLPDINQVDSKPLDSKLPDINQVDSKLPDINQVDSKPLDSKLPDINQVDSKLPDINQVDSKLPDSNQVDSKLPDSNQVDSKPIDSKPVDSKLPDSNLVDINLIAINLVDSSLISSLGAVAVKHFSAGKQAFTELWQIAVKAPEDSKKTDGEEDRLKRDGKKQEATSEGKEDAGMEDADASCAAETTECPEKVKDVDEGEGNYEEPSEEESVGIDDVGAEGEATKVEAVEFGTAPEGSQAKEEPRGREAIQNPENDNAADGEASQKGKEKMPEAEQVGKDSCEREDGRGQEKGPGTETDELQVGGAAVLDQRDNTKEAEADRVCCQVSLPQRKRQSSSVGDVVDGEKAEQTYGDMFANESLLAQGSLKVKSTANETTGNNGGRKKQTKQSSRRHGKKVATRSVVGRSSGARNVGGGSDDDDGEGRKPRKSGQDKKQPGCEGQALPKKKRQAKDKTQRRSPSPTAKTPGEGGSRNPLPPGARSKQPGRGLRGVVAADVLPAGARLKQTGRGLEGVTGATVSKDGRLQIGGSDSEKHPHSSSSLNQSMRRMSLGGAANQANVDPGGDVERSNLKASTPDHFLSGLRPVKRRPHTLKNVEASRRHDGIKAHELAAGGFNSLPDEALAGVAVSEPRLGCASASSEGPHALEPSEVEPAVEVPPSVVYGQLSDLVSYVADLQGQQHLSHEPKQGLHDGVILCKDLMGIVDGKYAEGTQYTKLEFLGMGSFGKVFLIRDKTTERNIVGKRVFCDFGDKIVLNEGLVWCGLEHRNIVPLLGLVRTGDTVVFLSEYHQGVQTLQQLVKERVLGQGRALHLIEQLFHALKYLHDRRIVHKDIKPDNILVLNDHIWLIDFGLAMQHGDDALKGTKCDMAPEIAGSQKNDERVDIWNALSMLNFAISGRPARVRPFDNITPWEGPMKDVPATADPRVRQFIEWGLQKDYLSLPTAAQVLENFPSQIVRDELYNTSVNDLAGPLTPRGRQEEEYQPLAANPRPGGPGEGGPDSLEISAMAEMDSLFEDRLLSGCPEMEDEEEEDIYGPSSMDPEDT